MYDDDDYDDRPPRDDRGRDRHRHRSPAYPRDQPYRSRHDSSRSPRRTPPRGPRADDSSAGRMSEGRQPYHRHGHPNTAMERERGRDRDGYWAGAGAGGMSYDEPRYRSRDSSTRGYDRRYRDYDDPRNRHHRSPRRGDSRSRSPYDSPDEGYYHDRQPRSSGPGRPNHTLKLDEIPDWMSSQEIDFALREQGAAGLVEVRIKSDDRSGPRRHYAFAEFKTDQDAVEFLERNYPNLEIVGANGVAVQIRADYSRERRQQPPPVASDDWKCTMCHFDNFSRRATCKQCKAPRSSESASDMRLDGISDECPQQAPSQFLVIRDLPSSANENTLASGIKTLYVNKGDDSKPASGSAPPKLKSTAPIGNTTGLGAKSGSLVRVFIIRDKASEISCNYGFAEFSTLEDARSAMAKYNASPQFTIGARPVTVAYIHSGVFIPNLYPSPDDDSRYSFATTHNPSLYLAYWNPTVYASELTVFNESLYEDKPRDSKEPKKDSEATNAKDSKKRKAEKDLVAPSGKKTIAMAPQLQMWASKHAELQKGKVAGQTEPLQNDKTPATGVNAVGGNKQAENRPVPTLTATISYADLDTMCCLLCRRKFKNEPSLRRHEQISDMHKANAGDESLIAKATSDLRSLGKEPVSNYRDRAKERRQTHNQPNKPKPHLPRKDQTGDKGNDSAPGDPAPAKAAVSKGAGLLAKMGWSKGEGLGAEGSGRTDIIETTAYNPGVGLGAEGGKLGDAVEEAARATRNDYSDFVAKAKDKARQRYERME